MVASSVDLGMRAVLTRGKEHTGTLFKPNHNSVSTLQLSALSEALVHGAETKGVFVSALTGDESAPAWVRPVELVDALRFFTDLKIIQIPKYSSQGDFLAAHELNLMTRIKAADNF